jgi:photosystem II stability/assembly factor-like uncharacterized protein
MSVTTLPTMTRWVLGALVGAALACPIALFAEKAPAASSADPRELLLQPLEWRSIGPFRGGRVLTVSGVPGEPDHFYFGAVNGGVWETGNAGRTWKPIFDAVNVGSIGALAVAPSDPSVIYVGTGEADMRSDIAQGAGLFRSSDAGRTWQSIGLEDSQQIGRILVDPKNPNEVLVAALGHPYGGNEMRGVFRSTDGGAHWQRTLFKNSDTGAIDLAATPGHERLFASLWQTRRPPWNVYPPSSGPGGGLYQSTDRGLTWQPLVGHGLPEHPGRIGIAVSPSQPQRVFALIDAAEGGLFRSDDGGASWRQVSADRRIWQRGWYFGGVTIDPANPDTVYVCNTAMYRSDDGGMTFVPVKGELGGDDYHQLWIDPHAPRRQILGVDQGALVTLDGGETWSSWYNQPTGQFYHVVTDNRFPYWVYGAQQDSGAAGVPSRTDHIDGINITQFREATAGGESDNIAPDPADPEVIFGGRVDKLDLRTGQTQSVDPTLAHPDLYRRTWTLPLVFGTAGSRALYFGNQRIFRSTDRGEHWEPMSPDLSREAPATPSTLDAATVNDDEHGGTRRGVVYTIGPSPIDERLIWAGTDDGLIWRSADSGAHWANVTPSALTAWSKVGVIEPSHFSAMRAYAAVDRHRLDDPRPYIYRTDDGGKSWRLIVRGIADGGVLNAVNVIREDPVHPGLLYCGTERGVYVSFDDGAQWLPLQQNLPRTSVRDLQVHGADLVIATHGRGFWIMDDIALLRSLADEAGQATRLLPPSPTYRIRPTGFTGTPMPKDEPRGNNPPLGAMIDYVLARAANTLTLTISDAGGSILRVFSASDPQAAPDLTKIEITPDWIAVPQSLSSSAGAHRFVWDLHASPAAALKPEDSTEQELGVWVPPGEYELDLGVDNVHYRQSLQVAPDPRVRVAPGAYAQQFALARDIERSRVKLALALAEAATIHTQITERKQHASPATVATLAAADSKLLAISDLSPAKSSPDATGASPTTIHGLRYLAGAFHGLARAVDGADAAPTADAKSGYAAHRALLEQVLKEWEEFKAADLAQLNAQLTTTGAEAIDLKVLP